MPATWGAEGVDFLVAGRQSWTVVVKGDKDAALQPDHARGRPGAAAVPVLHLTRVVGDGRAAAAPHALPVHRAFGVAGRGVGARGSYDGRGRWREGFGGASSLHHAPLPRFGTAAGIGPHASTDA